MITRVARFMEDVVCFGIGRFLLRAVSLGRLDPRPNGISQPWVTLLGVLVAFGAIAVAAVWPHASSTPWADSNIFHTGAQFLEYVSRLDLAPLPVITAIERLSSEGFRCETFDDGNVACFREARRGLCGERQFVDLIVPAKAGTAHTVLTRIGRTCS